MLDKLDALGAEVLNEVDSANSLQNLEEIRVSVLGKKGRLSDILKGLGKLSPTERPKVGSAANQWKKKIESALTDRKTNLADLEIERRVANERVDITLPSRRPHAGSVHLITQTTRKIIAACRRIGFDVTTGPEIESEYLTFDAINIPQDHPARDMQDTFFMGPGVVLRTHTSPVQMRTMLSKKWPVRILCPGAVYRCDNDATHSPMFHQIEGLWVDRKVTMADLKGTLQFLAQEIFGADTKIRLRPSYFPFTEPSAEVDISCIFCKGKGCKICKQTGWIEILGSGMVHPKLFENAGYDPGEISGYAFGIGIERTAMLLHGVPDLRLMFQSDVRMLSQF